MAVSWPNGFSSGAAAAGIKQRDLDVGVLVCDGPAVWAGTFTKNAAAAACVQWSRDLRGRSLRAVVVNSGNANACTGERGETAVRETAATTADTVGCAPNEIAIASTGPIGVPLPVDKMRSGVTHALGTLTADVDPFSLSILTTDTRPKVARGHGDGVDIVGVAKGAAMLAPNMATMLAFIATDADVDARTLQSSLSGSVARSFDRISVDACESTNDSVFLLSSGRGPRVSAEAFTHLLEEVCGSLAEQMVRDAEGGSRLVRIQVAGADDEAKGVELARAIAASTLWRAALHGGDPNWGRVLAALGSVDRGLDLEKVHVAIGDAPVFNAGEPTGHLAAASQVMDSDEFAVICRVGGGDTFVEVLTTDLSPEYVRLNATGSS